jgi:hypothetical protein
MTTIQRFKLVTTSVVTIFVILTSGFASAEEVAPLPKVGEGFRFAITPYVWVPSVHGTVDYDNTQIATASMSGSTIVKNLDTGFMLDGEIHYGRWGILGNATFAKLKMPNTQANLPAQGTTATAQTDIWMGIYTAAGTYTAYSSEQFYLDVLAGARFLHLNSKTNLSEPAAQSTLFSGLSSTDAVGGVQGRIRIGESRFFVPYYVDAGGGSAIAKFTSQQILGVGYSFKLADVLLVYNNLYYNFNKNNYSAYVDMGGPAIAATFRF